MFHFSRSMLIIVFFLNSLVLNASAYDDDVLEIYSKILPRFVLMSNLKDKAQENTEICVAHDELDSRIALTLINKINTNYPNGIKDHKLKLLDTTYSNLHKCENSQLVFLFNTDDENIAELLAFFAKKQTLTVSYDQKILKNGVDVSLFLGRKITPYVNVNSIREKKISFDNILLRISKIYSYDKQ